MAYNMALLLDSARKEKIKGTPVEQQIQKLFGGEVEAVIMEIPEEHAKKILDEFTTARIDSRGFLEDIPVALKRAIFSEVASKGSTGPEVLDATLAKLDEIKEEAKKESEYIPPPEI